MLAFHGSKGADSIAFSPDGRVLALVSDTLHLWDVLTDRELLTVPHKYAPVVFAPNGSVIAVQAAGSPAIELLEPETGKVVMTLIGHEMLATAMAFSPDSTLVASASYDGTVRVWDVVTGGEVRVLTLGMMDSSEGSVLQPRAAFSISFSPDGSTLAAGSLDGIVRLWEARTWQEEAQLASHTACVAALAFSPDGRTLASGSWDNTVKLWDLVTHSEVGSLSGHTKWISAMAFSPDGRTLASGSWDGTIKLWDPLTHIVLRTLSRHTSAVTALAFDRDGSVLATASASGEDGMVLLWDVSGR
jgi:WD40 repeat protein